MWRQITYNITFIFVLLCILFIYPTVFIYRKGTTLDAVAFRRFDYIIVGGGTTGCVLAAKLSENKSNSVLLIEAGDYFNIISSVPLLTIILQGTQYDWNFKTTPQTFSSYGLRNQKQSLPRGKGLGGSNQINYMIHDDFIAGDVEMLKSFGSVGWDIHKLSQYMEQLFNKSFQDPCFTYDTHCYEQFAYKLTVAKSELGNLLREAVNDLNNHSINYYSVKSTINRGQRWTTYHSHLQPILQRNNLDILLNTEVVKIKFYGKHAIGVEILNKNNSVTIYCKRDIILSAGTFSTPYILLKSGVVPSTISKKHDIYPLHYLEGVGRNLHDQLIMPLFASIQKPISVTFYKIFQFAEIWNYIINGKGILSTTPVSGFVRKDDVLVLLFEMGSVDKEILGEIANFKSQYFESLFPFHKNLSQEGFVILSTCLKPKSRGNLQLNESNIFEAPVIDPMYLSNKFDVDCIMKAIQLAEKLVNTKSFQSIGAKIHWPQFKNCNNITDPSEDKQYLECIIRSVALTAHHPGGTCQMGTKKNKDAVVDNQLRVIGLSGLRIIDASILPEPLTAFPNSLLVAMAEYAADIISSTNNIYLLSD